jgi:hypothetical protein
MMAATTKSRATNPAFYFPQRNYLLSHQPRANRTLSHEGAAAINSHGLLNSV